jgi:hypothetical protein
MTIKHTLAFLFLFCVSACYVQAKEQNVLVGSIPGDAIAKYMLAIDQSENVDFIRLRIMLNEGDRRFDLRAVYGIGKPNTRDFENGGKTLAIKGDLEMIESGRHLIYRLVNQEEGVDLSMMRINDQIFHVLSPNGRLLTGNGGWNYTISLDGDKKKVSSELPNERKVEILKDPATIVFAGRTPCVEIARELKISFEEECFKLKWKLTLNRDPETGSPTTFQLQRTFRRSEPIAGKWSIVKDAGSVIYRLDAGDGSRMSFLRFDDSLFFLDNAGRLIKGNEDFGYTLDGRQEAKTADLSKPKME